MAPPKNASQSSNNLNIPNKSFDTVRNLILACPTNFIGSTKERVRSLWVYNPDSQMEHRSVRYVPGLYKIFDEILVNATDIKQRDPKMDLVEVEINQEQKFISVFYTGVGIQNERRQGEEVLVPELIFYNYDDMVKKFTGGNGYVVPLTSIFSTKFETEIADGKRKRKYTQVFTDNMLKNENPVITNCEDTDNWTKVRFKPDLARFNMIRLEDDVVALMKKRVVDLAGCLSAYPGKKVRVLLNGNDINVESFHDYAQLYLNSANENREVPLPRIDNSEEGINPMWQISVSKSNGRFQQVSFVNNINTINGGTHVDYIMAEITKFIIDTVKKKKKNAGFDPYCVKNLLWIFVNSHIDNPTFDSISKETLITETDIFKATCHPSHKFLTEVLDSSGVVESLLKQTRKSDDIEKLVDATEAGGSRSLDCTLILVEGDSAKLLAEAGISIMERRDVFGVYPLRGKLMNVRDVTNTMILKNAVIKNIIDIMGLKRGESYHKEESVKQLRYGHLMIMADPDLDGVHFKGLIINFIHKLWPSLLQRPSFLLDFITPMLKVVPCKGNEVRFYSEPEYREWAKRNRADAKNWKVKRYKGLGSIDSDERNELFSNFEKYKRTFLWSNDEDGDAIELAFSKKKAADRKAWLQKEENGTSYLDPAKKEITFTDFVNKELKLYSRKHTERSIPSLLDGLKPSERKILHCAFKMDDEIVVEDFSGIVSNMVSYHHGGVSLQNAVIHMAQDFVGSNNINLLRPVGTFGDRRRGGERVANPKYIKTKLADVTRSIFLVEDDVLLDYVEDGGLKIEPVWYMPIIPMVLVNGASGIATGWKTEIPNYKPEDVIANIRHLINGKIQTPMKPWYKNFKGSIQRKISAKEAEESSVTYTVTGKIDVVDLGKDSDDETVVTLAITELPIKTWTGEYEEEILKMMKKDCFIKDFRNYSTIEAVKFTIFLSKRNFELARQEGGLLRKFKLTSELTTCNMHLFNKDNKIDKYASPEKILEEFYHVRLECYRKRKERELEFFETALQILRSQVRVVYLAANCLIDVGLPICELTTILRIHKFLPIKSVEARVRSIVEVAEVAEFAEFAEGSEVFEDYDYLISVLFKIWRNRSSRIEKLKKLFAKWAEVLNQYFHLRNQPVEFMWLDDLTKLEDALGCK